MAPAKHREAHKISLLLLFLCILNKEARYRGIQNTIACGAWYRFTSRSRGSQSKKVIPKVYPPQVPLSCFPKWCPQRPLRRRIQNHHIFSLSGKGSKNKKGEALTDNSKTREKIVQMIKHKDDQMTQ